ncbi:KilA-N domain-containing protein [Chitinophaga sp.]|uniref:KilA-N domain-containing protein n=1 Tax=Chitinophaga sp. TaxID=1869181 RepID=UPI0031E2706C
MVRRREIIVNNTVICIVNHNNDDYISLTDMVRDMSSSNVIIGNWLRKKDTIEYLGLWEQLYNPNFKLIEFDEFKNAAGTNRFALSPQLWISKTNAVGIISKSGRYSGVPNFRMACISVKLYVIARIHIS